MSKMDKARVMLKKHWGHDDFRSAQQPILEEIFNGGDALGILATGSGKSALFQIPPLVIGGTALVISPLIALMHDQVADCNSRGIPASYVNSHVNPAETTRRLKKFKDGEYRVFYVAPERMHSLDFREPLRETAITLIAIDEGHCASSWGFDFRPAYQRIHELVAQIKDGNGNRPPVLAVTATATPDIENDIAQACGFNKTYLRAVGDPIRENLDYRVICGSVESNLKKIVGEFSLGQGRYIIYAPTRKMVDFVTEEVARLMQERYGVKTDKLVRGYHAGMDEKDRTSIQNAFKSGEAPVIVATNAFGMGIDVPDIRGVYHLGVPDSLEDLCQALGRAGRDGKPATATLIHDIKILRTIQFLIDLSNPPWECYLLVWQYLHEKLMPDEILRQTAEEISFDMRRTFGKSYHDGQISTCLHAMELSKLVERESGGALTTVEFNMDALRKYAGKPQRLPSVLTARALVSKISDSAERQQHNYITHDLASSARLTMDQVNESIERLELDGLIETAPLFRGKTTKIIQYDAKVEDHLPKDRIEKKRRLDLERFSKMIAYASSPDPVRYIRKYFLGDDARRGIAVDRVERVG